jgi:hypothetical protein
VRVVRLSVCLSDAASNVVCSDILRRMHVFCKMGWMEAWPIDDLFAGYCPICPGNSQTDAFRYFLSSD